MRARQSLISGQFKAAFRMVPKASASQHPHPCGMCSLMGNRRHALFTKIKFSCFRIINGVLIEQREACPSSDRSTDTAIIINAVAMQRFVMPKTMRLRLFSPFSTKQESPRLLCSCHQSLRSRLSVFENSGGNAANINSVHISHLEYLYHLFNLGNLLLALLSFLPS